MTKEAIKKILSKVELANQKNQRQQMNENVVMKDWKKSFTSQLVRKGRDACLKFLQRQMRHPMPNLDQRKKMFGLGKDTSKDFTRKAGHRWQE